jgi:hypothetical protein
VSSVFAEFVNKKLTASINPLNDAIIKGERPTDDLEKKE